MKTITAFILTAAAALALTGCGAPANNAPASTNTAKPVAAAPTAEALLAIETEGTDAFFKHDTAKFEPMLSDKYGDTEGGKHNTKADVMKRMADLKCDFKDWKFDQPQVSKIDDDTYALIYNAAFDGSCTMNGRTEKSPSHMRGASVYVRSGDKWLAAWSGLMPMPDAKRDDNPSNAAKKDDAVKNEQPKKDDPRKDTAQPNAKPGANSASNTTAVTKPLPGSNTGATGAAPPAEPKPDANTEALVKIEAAGWTAWKDKNAKWFEDNAAKNLAFVDPAGKVFTNRADTIKEWGNTSCENVTTVDVKKGFAWALSPTVELLSFDATADGTCGGMKNAPMMGLSAYVKEGDAWKIAFAWVQNKSYTPASQQKEKGGTEPIS